LCYALWGLKPPLSEGALILLPCDCVEDGREPDPRCRTCGGDGKRSPDW